MTRAPHRRWLLCSCVALAFAALACQAQQPDPAAPPAAAAQHPLSEKQIRAADDAYLAGARLLTHNDPAAAQLSFARAVELNPNRTEYALALDLAREHHVTALVQKAARERALGRTASSASLLEEARTLSPDNVLVTQHLAPITTPDDILPGVSTAQDEIARLGGPIQLSPASGVHNLHRRGDTQQILQEVYETFGIKATFDPALARQPMRFDLDDADFATATRVALKMTHTFAVPLTSDSVLIAKDTSENRDRLIPLVEETFDLPGIPQEELTDLQNIAKNIFDIKQASIQKSGSRLVLRGNEDAMRLVNATFADMLDGGGDVVLQVHIYEYDHSRTRNVGVSLPTQAGAFSLAAEAQSIVSANQTLINQAVASGLLTLNGSYIQNLIKSAAFLVLSGAVTSSKFSTILGTFGGGLTFAGLFLGSGSTFNFLLNSSEVRLLDEVELRVGDNQTGNLRSGSRYPIVTSTYSSAVSSSVTSALSGVSINGSSAASLLAKYLNNTSTATVPQVQYEDLGLTLKTTPQIQKSGRVHVKLELKLESLGGSSLNNIPILNNRALISDVTIPAGQMAMLAVETSRSEQRSLSGLPGINEIPGFQGTNDNVDANTSELLITITPRIVRRRSPITATRRLLANVSPAEQ